MTFPRPSEFYGGNSHTWKNYLYIETRPNTSVQWTHALNQYRPVKRLSCIHAGPYVASSCVHVYGSVSGPGAARQESYIYFLPSVLVIDVFVWQFWPDAGKLKLKNLISTRFENGIPMADKLFQIQIRCPFHQTFPIINNKHWYQWMQCCLWYISNTKRTENYTQTLGNSVACSLLLIMLHRHNLNL